MRLEDQVCSLELAKRLKELGVRQESYFFYEWYSDRAWTLGISDWERDGGHTEISAFGVAELGEMIPKELNGYFITYIPSIDLGKSRGWVCFYRNTFCEMKMENIFATKEADARAKMLIYLIENGLIKEEDKAISKGKEGEQ